MSLFERRPTAAPRTSLALVPRCWECKLDKGCISPKMQPTGQGRKKILVVGEAPGEEEDKRNRQFVGKTGMLLRDTLKELGLSPDKDCVFTNSLICRPPGNKIKDGKMIEHCRPNLLKTIEEHKPNVIILLGARPAKSLIGYIVGDDPQGIRRWAGFQIPAHKPNAWICPTFHPSYVAREEKKPAYQVLRRMFTEHLKAAVRLKDKPWLQVPQYQKHVRVEMNAKKAAYAIRQITAKGKPVAFDFETTTLKPDSKQAQIYTCAIAVGDPDLAIAYPWRGKAIAATKELLKSKVPKIGFNLKFEDRWCRAKLGFNVRNFKHCGMITAHGLDCRHGITSAKFQAFILLGQGDYASHVRPFLKAKTDGGNEANRIREAPLEDLLLYNGMDALVEWHIWRKQKEMIR